MRPISILVRLQLGAAACLFFLALLAVPVQAAEFVGTVERVQTVELKKGWNSVFLEVEPTDPDPDVVFKDVPILLAATWFQKATSLEYISDPESKPWNDDGWGVWYAPDRPDSFLRTLHAIRGNSSYLIKCDRDYTWRLRGEVRHLPIKWKPNSYNHVGFSLDAQSPPVFADFFGGAKAHTGLKIYRLEGDHWRKVDAQQEQMRSGEAYWVFSEGKSTHQGPLDVRLELDSMQALVFVRGATSRLKLTNRSGSPIDVELEHSGELPMKFLATAFDEGAGTSKAVSLPFKEAETIDALDVGKTFALRLELDRAAMTVPLQQGLLKISTSMGTVTWLQILGSNPSLVDE